EAGRAGETGRIKKSFRLEAGPSSQIGHSKPHHFCCASNWRESEGHTAGSAASAECTEVWRFEPCDKIGRSTSTSGEGVRYPTRSGCHARPDYNETGPVSRH